MSDDNCFMITFYYVYKHCCSTNKHRDDDASFSQWEWLSISPSLILIYIHHLV